MRLSYSDIANRLHADEHKVSGCHPSFATKLRYNNAAAPAKTNARRPLAAFTFSAPEVPVWLAAEELPEEVPEAKPL